GGDDDGRRGDGGCGGNGVPGGCGGGSGDGSGGGGEILRRGGGNDGSRGGDLGRSGGGGGCRRRGDGGGVSGGGVPFLVRTMSVAIVVTALKRSQDAKVHTRTDRQTNPQQEDVPFNESNLVAGKTAITTGCVEQSPRWTPHHRHEITIFAHVARLGYLGMHIAVVVAQCGPERKVPVSPHPILPERRISKCQTARPRDAKKLTSATMRNATVLLRSDKVAVNARRYGKHRNRSEVTHGHNSQ
ncbi:hypothetical protein Vafri_8608, partial [Volvox africanus]